MEKITRSITGAHRIPSDFANPLSEDRLVQIRRQHRAVLITRLLRVLETPGLHPAIFQRFHHHVFYQDRKQQTQF